MIERYSHPRMKKVWTEENKFALWLEVEIAVCEAWAEIGEISGEDMSKIRKASFSLERMEEIFEVTHHDMTAFLGSVSQSLGVESRYLHLGLTSSDVMDTAQGLQLKEAAKILEEDIAIVISALEDKAIEHKYTIMAGRTHGVHAEPITLGLKMALWLEEMKRNAYRLAAAKEVISVGKISGAVGTHATVSHEVERLACDRLGLIVVPVSNQIIQRDRYAQFVTTLALIASSLEKFATEIRGLQRTEIMELAEPFELGQTGSSAMPHKRNPELCERICGLARLVRGYSLSSMENVPLWHERDISHSSAERVILPDSCIALDYMLSLFASIMRGLRVYPENMRRNLEITRGLIFSQRVLLALINKGVVREEAYKMVQDNAMWVWEGEDDFLNLLKSDERISNLLSLSELESLFDYSYYLKNLDQIFEVLGLNKH
jgi:adenylosuccinate lyase